MISINMYPALGFDRERLTPEEKMLLLCAVTSSSDGHTVKIRDLARGDIDWEKFGVLVSAYSLEALAYKHLQAFPDNVPQHVVGHLRDRAGVVLARNSRDIAEIKRLAALFDGKGFEAIFIKGASFLADVYTRPGLRYLSDIDILIKETDAARMAKILKSAGYAEAGDSKGFPRYRSQKVFSAPGGSCVDVHVDLVGRRLHNRFIRLDMERIWRDRRELDMAGSGIYGLDLLHDLAYQCLHLSMNHSFSGLKWYVDINEFLLKHSGELDWDGFLSLVKEYGIKRPVYYSLFFAKEMLAAQVPSRVLKELESSRRRYDTRLFENIKRNERGVDYLAELAMFDRHREMIKFVVMNVAVNPRLAGHFVKVFGRMASDVLGGRAKG